MNAVAVSRAVILAFGRRTNYETIGRQCADECSPRYLPWHPMNPVVAFMRVVGSTYVKVLCSID